MKTEIKLVEELISSLQKKYDKAPNQRLGSLINTYELSLRGLKDL
jgi:hypothetical protein